MNQAGVRRFRVLKISLIASLAFIGIHPSRSSAGETEIAGRTKEYVDADAARGFVLGFAMEPFDPHTEDMQAVKTEFSDWQQGALDQASKLSAAALTAFGGRENADPEILAKASAKLYRIEEMARHARERADYVSIAPFLQDLKTHQDRISSIQRAVRSAGDGEAVHQAKGLLNSLLNGRAWDSLPVTTAAPVRTPASSVARGSYLAARPASAKLKSPPKDIDLSIPVARFAATPFKLSVAPNQGSLPDQFVRWRAETIEQAKQMAQAALTKYHENGDRLALEITAHDMVLIQEEVFKARKDHGLHIQREALGQMFYALEAYKLNLLEVSRISSKGGDPKADHSDPIKIPVHILIAGGSRNPDSFAENGSRTVVESAEAARWLAQSPGAAHFAWSKDAATIGINDLDAFLTADRRLLVRKAGFFRRPSSAGAYDFIAETGWMGMVALNKVAAGEAQALEKDAQDNKHPSSRWIIDLGSRKAVDETPSSGDQLFYFRGRKAGYLRRVTSMGIRWFILDLRPIMRDASNSLHLASLPE